MKYNLLSNMFNSVTQQLRLLFIALLVVLSFGLRSIDTYAVTAEEACKSLENGFSCTYDKGSGRSGTEPPFTKVNGACDRNNTGVLYCNDDLSGWQDCFNLSQVSDYCVKDNALGQCQAPTGRGTIPVCVTPPSATCSSAASCPTGAVCTGSKCTLSSSGSTTPQACQNCGGTSCATGKVCIQGDDGPECVDDKGASNKCGTNACPTGKVCVQGDDGPECKDNACPNNGGGGNGGGGTPPTNTPPSGGNPSPQTITFQNPIAATSIPELVATLVNALLGILATILVAVLVSAGFKYMTSTNPGDVGQALEAIRNAIIGLMIIMGSFLITQYVISALV